MNLFAVWMISSKVSFRNDYERVKILFRYGYRLEKKESMTDPLKKIELFKVALLYITKLMFSKII